MSHCTMRMGQGRVQPYCPMQDHSITMASTSMNVTIIRTILGTTVITMMRILTIISFAFSSQRRILPPGCKPWRTRQE